MSEQSNWRITPPKWGPTWVFSSFIFVLGLLALEKESHMS